VAVQDSAHNVEIELKARIQNKEEIESRLAKFMRLTGNIDKRDEYWEVSGKDPLSSGTFRFRVRREAGHTTITFKDKTFDGNLEINREFEFGIDNEAAFRAFVERLQGRFVYRKRKTGTRWESETGVVAEVVEVASLGLFLEVECVCHTQDAMAQEEAKCQLYDVIDWCDIPRRALEPRPYSQLLGY
jgi:predicted adenylyl cyclase CyaB